jgi:ribosomal-protein-alanine N-acetyltransferase
MTPDRLADLCARAYRHMAPWGATAFEAALAQDTTQLTCTEHAFVLSQVVLDEAEILALAADPDFQRKGEASRALESCIDRLTQRGVTRIFLEVAAKNTPARGFYAQHNFTQAGIRKGYYRLSAKETDDAIIMTREIA